MYNVGTDEAYINCFSQYQYNNWEKLGIRNQEGFYNEVGIYDSSQRAKECAKKISSVFEGFYSIR